MDGTVFFQSGEHYPFIADWQFFMRRFIVFSEIQSDSRQAKVKCIGVAITEPADKWLH
jgi:hypothetical protein